MTRSKFDRMLARRLSSQPARQSDLYTYIEWLEDWAGRIDEMLQSDSPVDDYSWMIARADRRSRHALIELGFMFPDAMQQLVSTQHFVESRLDEWRVKPSDSVRDNLLDSMSSLVERIESVCSALRKNSHPDGPAMESGLFY